MAQKEQQPTLLTEMWAFNLYKRNQGRLTRQLTAVGAGLIVFFGVWTLSTGPLNDAETPIRVGIPWGLGIAGAWFVFRLLHWPPFADFLISVEAEIDKVTWASRAELKRNTLVVLVTMTFLGLVLLGYDMFWQWFFRMIGFLRF
jgi:preprotein translocase subunit SecE